MPESATRTMRLPSLIETLLENGIPVTMRHSGGMREIEFELPGFYKAGTAVLRADQVGGWILQTRNRSIEIHEFSDLVAENAYWLRVTSERMDEDVNPSDEWREHLKAHGHIEEYTAFKLTG